MQQTGTHEFCEFAVHWHGNDRFDRGVMSSALLGQQRPVDVMERCVLEAARLLNENGYDMTLGSSGPARIRQGSAPALKKPHG